MENSGKGIDLLQTEKEMEMSEVGRKVLPLRKRLLNLKHQRNSQIAQ